MGVIDPCTQATFQTENDPLVLLGQVQEAILGENLRLRHVCSARYSCAF
ncbi:Protein of unknown function, partial [Gryllus bimaculatus]